MNTGRNQPCPCGSGKKYKHCCVDKEKQLVDHNNDLEYICDQYFGYLTEASIDSLENFFDFEDSVCLATLNRNKKDVQELIQNYNVETKIGDWVISTGDCDNVKIYGPFKSMEDAFKFGEKEFNIKRWSRGMEGSF